MTDRPIIFSAPMVRALLDGRKTQTRRVLKIKGRKGFFQFGRSDLPDYDWTFRRADHVWEDWKHGQLLRKLPYAPGDRLWVREAVIRQETDQGVGYQTYSACGSKVYPLTQWYHRRKSVPSIHMPRWASRLTLAVTDVRVQQLQDISGRDVIAEGVRCGGCQDVGTGDYSACRDGGCFAGRTDFRTLWNSLHRPDAWAANPWVVAITFDVHRCNIDTLSEKADA